MVQLIFSRASIDYIKYNENLDSGLLEDTDNEIQNLRVHFPKITPNASISISKDMYSCYEMEFCVLMYKVCSYLKWDSWPLKRIIYKSMHTLEDKKILAMHLILTCTSKVCFSAYSRLPQAWTHFRAKLDLLNIKINI